jgi:hypothetical protein
MAQLGIACAANDMRVISVVFESEAWAAVEKRDPGDKSLDPKDYTPPSERPDRQEIIMVASRSLDGREAFAGIPITGRHEDESLILGEENVHEFTEDGFVKDSLLSEFFQAHAMASLARLEAERLLAEGKEVPEPLQEMVLLMDSCPIKIK